MGKTSLVGQPDLGEDCLRACLSFSGFISQMCRPKACPRGCWGLSRARERWGTSPVPFSLQAGLRLALAHRCS